MVCFWSSLDDSAEISMQLSTKPFQPFTLTPTSFKTLQSRNSPSYYLQDPTTPISPKHQSYHLQKTKKEKKTKKKLSTQDTPPSERICSSKLCDNSSGKKNFSSQNVKSFSAQLVQSTYIGSIEVSLPPQSRKEHATKVTVHNALQETKRHPEDVAGWTLVTRKKRSNPFISKVSQNSSNPALHGKLLELSRQRKCFKCFGKGHIQRFCTSPRKCFYCHAQGHLYHRCTSLPAKPTSFSLLRSHQPTNPKISLQKSSQTHPKTMATQLNAARRRQHVHDIPRNWETMQLEDPALIGERIMQLNCFLPERLELKQINRFLERSAYVMPSLYSREPNLKTKVALRLANFFRASPRDFMVSQADPSFGDLLVQFPTAQMRDDACRQGIFRLGGDITVSIVRWSFHHAMEYKPTTHRARIRIEGMPLQNWNKADIQMACSGFGYPMRVAPYFYNGNFHSLRAFVACPDPCNIPHFIQFHTEPSKTQITVVLEGWMPVDKDTRDFLIPPPSSPSDVGDDDSSDSSDGDHPPKRKPTRPTGPSSSHRSVSQSKGKNIVSSSEPPRFFKNWGKKAASSLQWIPKRTLPTQKWIPKGTFLKAANHASDLQAPFSNQKISSEIKIDSYGQICLIKKGSPPKILSSELPNVPNLVGPFGIPFNISHILLDRIAHVDFCKLHLHAHGRINVKLNFRPTPLFQKVSVCDTNSTPLLDWFIPHLQTTTSLSQPGDGPSQQNSPISHLQMGFSDSTPTGSPPGFPGPPAFVSPTGSPPGFSGPPLFGPATAQDLATTTPVVRRSPRLMAKGISTQTQPKPTRKKSAKPKPVMLDYLNSHAPLTLDQGQKLLLAAGFQLTEDLLKQLANSLQD